MIRISTAQIRQFERQLQQLSRSALPSAVQSTLNKAAFDARSKAVEIIRSDMTLRNRWTEKSIRVVKARRSTNINSMESEIGSVVDYMRVQEMGGRKVAEGRKGVSIPTSYSAGQGENQAPRTRLSRGANKMQAIQLRSGSRVGRTRKQRNLIAIRATVESGKKFVYLEFQRTKGIFRIVGGKRNPKIKMVHDMTNRSITIPKSKWLEPAHDYAQSKMRDNYSRALIREMRRLGIR